MVDLAFYDSPEYVRANGGIHIIIVFIDVFSKMFYVEVMRDKSGLNTMIALKK
jgi:hypothetical protein